MTDTNPAIEVAGLPKSYGDHSVLAGVDLTVPEGTVYALLGPNGAGKTTIVNILSTLLTPDDGEIRVAGFDVRREPAGVRAAIGVTGQFSANGLTRASAVLPVARVRTLQHQLPGLSMGEGIIESRPGGYQPTGGDPPRRARSRPSPLERDAWLASLAKRG